MVASQLTASAMALGPAPSEGSSLAGAAPTAQEPIQNRVKDSKSPFLAAAATSPVAWQPLDDAAIERARRENKLIYLHIGYQACHHCQLMASDSFNNSSCASILNTSFVPILVDREQRPDIDTIYMNYVQGITNTGGWPLNVFVTAEMEPVFGGTYFPGPEVSQPSSDDDKEEAMADFLTVLKKVRDAWEDQESRCRKEAAEVMTQLRDFAAEGTLGSKSIAFTPSLGTIPQGSAATTAASRPRPERKGSIVSSELDLDQIEEAYRKLAGTFDPFDGGFGLPPKFPTPPKLSFLLNLNQSPAAVQDVVGEEECKHANKIVLDTLRKIRDGAMRDHIGGNGFARFSVTSDWSIPNFERITPDNAGLLSLYHEAWLVSGGKTESEFYDVVVELVQYLTSSPICLPEGGFASSQAAASLAKRGDRNPREGAYYTWTSREFESVVAPSEDRAAGLAAAHFGVLEDGNVGQQYDPNDDFINQNVIRITKPLEEVSKQFNLPIEDVQQQIAAAKKNLREKAEKERQKPAVDDKVVTGWNGLVISALSRVAAQQGLGDELSKSALAAATKAVQYIKTDLWDEKAKQLYRIGKNGRETAAFADDYAYLILGLLDLSAATSDESFLQFAHVLQETQNQSFRDEARGGFFATTSNYPHSPIRLKDGMDTALPSVNAVSVENLFRLSEKYPDAGYKDRAEETINAFEPEMLQYPWLYPGLLRGVIRARLIEA